MSDPYHYNYDCIHDFKVLSILGFIHEMFSNYRIGKLVDRMREKYISIHQIFTIHGNTIEIR